MDWCKQNRVVFLVGRAHYLLRTANQQQLFTTHGSGFFALPFGASTILPCVTMRRQTPGLSCAWQIQPKMLLKDVTSNSGYRCNGELWWQQPSLTCLSCGWVLRQASISYTCSQNVRSLGPDKSQALAIFHAYTGCDTFSSFHTRSKKFVWGAWKALDEVTATFHGLCTGPFEIKDNHVVSLERFTILLYDHTSNVVNINEACQELFTTNSRHIEAIPPTRTAIVQHIKRAVYQAGDCWARCWKPPCICLQLKTGDGVTHRTGSQCGPCCLRQALLPGSYKLLWLQTRYAGRLKGKKVAL